MHKLPLRTRLSRAARSLFILLGLSAPLSACQQAAVEETGLYEGFTNPPATARPFVRWWWNGNCLEEEELKREVGVLHDAGFGGVEINPIAMPGGAKDIGVKPIPWLSQEWTRLLGVTTDEIHAKGMIADLIVGSGWPFGGEFLEEEQTIQCVVPIRKIYKSGDCITVDRKTLKFKGHDKLLFLTLIPADAGSKEEVIDLMPEYSKENRLEYTIAGNGKDKEYVLVAGVHRQDYTKVILGAPGAAGPVMNHYRKEVTFAYLNRLKKISEDLGRPLSEMIRALFCDSLELSGSNWTDDFQEIFYETYHYRLEPYYPFVFYVGTEGYPAEQYTAPFMDEIKRVRYDYNKLLSSLLLDNFTRVFHRYCKDNGLKSRFQAYGSPLLMDMLNGYMIPDIPEGNNWLRRPWADIENRAFNWPPQQGTMIWNHYAASAAHHTGKKIVSCEAMTCLNNVFKISLETIKNHDDMNFISGINHTVLHGFNYTPPAAGFPGWVRYGTYFNEQNTWWPYVDRWIDYNARLSYLFQESTPEKTWAVLPPEGDHWSENGLYREPFQTRPWYCFHLWESLSKAGSSLDYVNERLLQENGHYKGIILCDVESLSPKTAAALEAYVGKGGKLVYINRVPSRSLTLADGAEGDRKVQEEFKKINHRYADRVYTFQEPKDSASLLPWTVDLLKKTGMQPDVKIDRPNGGVYQIHATFAGKDIYFFTNALRREEASFKATFPTGEKKAWLWNPEDGSRLPYPTKGKANELDIYLGPLQSLLLVFEPADAAVSATDCPETARLHTALADAALRPVKLLAPWKISFRHMNGEKAETSSETLYDFRESQDPMIRSFAGTVEYTTVFEAEGNEAELILGEVNKGICEVSVNGKPAGCNWYGTPRFNVKGLLESGKNTLSIRYTTVLSNYCQSIRDENPMARNWTWGHTPIPNGLTGQLFLNCR